MQNKQVKWLIYTVFVGMIPIFFRILVSLAAESGDISMLVPTDVISFGLVLHISMINEIEHVKGDHSWKTVINGVSIMFLTLYGGFSGILILANDDNKLVNTDSTLALVTFLAIISFGIGVAVFFKILSTTHSSEQNHD